MEIYKPLGLWLHVVFSRKQKPSKTNIVSLGQLAKSIASFSFYFVNMLLTPLRRPQFPSTQKGSFSKLCV